jgi:hypothetical protein
VSKRRGAVLAAIACFVSLVIAGAGQGASAAAVELRQSGNRLVATGESGNAYFGFSVALSGDGNTALVGAIYDSGNKGAAWVFTRSGSGWTQEAKLAPTDEAGRGQFGWSVALSADGNIALVGAPADGGGEGAAWVFTRVTQPEVAPRWEQRAQKLTGYQCSLCGLPTQFGASVSLSADGSVAVIGGPQTTTDKGLGAAWAAFRSGNVWLVDHYTMKSLTYSQLGSFGASVAVSGDGMSVLVGAPGSGFGGVVGRFVRAPNESFQESSRAPYAPGAFVRNFGSSVALSYDGLTAVVGAPREDARGNAFAYGAADANSQWLLQGELVPSGSFPGVRAFGTSVAVSDDGNLAVVGGSESIGQRGAFWTFVRTQAQWVRRSAAIEAGGEVGAGFFGTSLDLAADGESAFVGAPQHDGGVGAVWAFTDPPDVTSLTPRSGPTAGGTTVAIQGSNFDGAKTVRFGARAAASFTVLNPTRIDAVSPPGSAGTADVTVANSGGPSETSASTRFTYVAPAAPPPPPSPPPPPPPTATGTTPPPPPGTVNQRPTIRILSARFRGSRIYLRLRVCDDSRKNLTILERDSKPGVRPFTRRFMTLRPPRPCAALTRSWRPAPRFREGRYTVTLWARDKSGKTSLPARRTFVR